MLTDGTPQTSCPMLLSIVLAQTGARSLASSVDGRALEAHRTRCVLPLPLPILQIFHWVYFVPLSPAPNE